jgi:GT2 family glycosyltransferase
VLTSEIAAIVTAYERIEQTLATLRVIENCQPRPAEILVHVDGNQVRCAEAIQAAFPDVRVLLSGERVGPGGGRNKLIAAARSELVASFDDDSYPIDSDYFDRATELFKKYPNASVICAGLYHRGETIALDARNAQWTADFAGGACVYRRSVFVEAGGYVPLPVAYGMEEVDLALRLHARGARILTSSWLRVFHDTDLQRHAEAGVTAGSIANLALLTYLRYPASLWIVGLGQCLKRVIWLMRHGRLRGILSGVAMIPAHLRAHRRYRTPLQYQAVRSYLALRRAPVPEAV